MVVGSVFGGAVRPPRWLFGATGGVQVWHVDTDPRVRASVLVTDDAPLILLSSRVVGTDQEHDALAWAMARIAEGERGFFVRLR